jgi:plasmid stability protein
MASLTLPDLPPELERDLRLRAERAGRSMEDEALALLDEEIRRSEAARNEALAARIKHVQDAVAQYIPPGSYSVDAFLAERRLEAMREEDGFADGQQSEESRGLTVSSG